ncbi:hypothetical protein Hanom_Chr07g00641471 [Helianthus anomalus]
MTIVRICTPIWTSGFQLFGVLWPECKKQKENKRKLPSVVYVRDAIRQTSEVKFGTCKQPNRH